MTEQERSGLIKQAQKPEKRWNNDRMPWPADYARVSYHSQSTLSDPERKPGHVSKPRGLAAVESS